MQEPKIENKEILSSEYMIVDWGSVIFASTGFVIIVLLSFNISNFTFYFLSLLSLILSIYISSYFYLNRTSFFKDKIEIHYLIRRRKYGKKRIINLSDVIAFRFWYNGGKGSGGYGILKTYYQVNGHNKILRTSMDRKSAAKLFLELNKQEITLEVVPVWVLSEFGFTPVTKDKNSAENDNEID